MARLVGFGWLGVTMALCGMTARAQVALDNDAVVKMAKSGLGEAVILSVIDRQPGTYEVTPDALVALKNAGVTDREIAAMTAKGPAAIVNDYDGLETGVYYKTKGATEWTNMPSERVYSRSGGALKSIATRNIIKQDMNGRIDGQTSRLALGMPFELLIVTPEGIEATDFTLVELNQKKDAREFRTRTGGVFHSSTDVSRSNVPFEQKKLARHVYRITLPAGVGKGEYAFLAAGLTGTSATGSRGKAYTFHVTE